jgi:hypothetical protein
MQLPMVSSQRTASTHTHQAWHTLAPPGNLPFERRLCLTNHTQQQLLPLLPHCLVAPRRSNASNIPDQPGLTSPPPWAHKLPAVPPPQRWPASPATLSSSSCHFWRTVFVRLVVVMPAFQESSVCASCPPVLLLLLVRGPYTSTRILHCDNKEGGGGGVT